MRYGTGILAEKNMVDKTWGIVGRFHPLYPYPIFHYWDIMEDKHGITTYKPDIMGDSG